MENWFNTPPPIRDDSSQLVAYYKESAEEDPEDKWSAWWYAMATHQSGDLGAAIELYDNAIAAEMQESEAAFYIGDCHDRQGGPVRSD